MAIVALPTDLTGLGLAPAVATLIGSSITAPIAGVGTAQAGAAPLQPGALNLVTTASGQTAVLLPVSQPVGTSTSVYVSTATAALVFPPTGCNINEIAVNTSFSVAQARTATFMRISPTKWVVQYGA